MVFHFQKMLNSAFYIPLLGVKSDTSCMLNKYFVLTLITVKPAWSVQSLYSKDPDQIYQKGVFDFLPHSSYAYLRALTMSYLLLGHLVTPGTDFTSKETFRETLLTVAMQ